MWLFCRQGFFSAVEHRDDKDMILLRARFGGDLEKLLSSCGGANYMPTIEHTPEADYAYRVAVPRTLWREIVAQVAEEIDSDNFKNSVHEGHGSARDEAYMECWWALRKAQGFSRTCSMQ